MSSPAKWILSAALAVLACGSADAGIAYQFADTSGAGISGLQLTEAGGTVSFRIYLVEDGLAPTPTPITSNGGLDRYGIKLEGADTGDGISALVITVASNEAQFTGTTTTSISGVPTGQLATLSDRTPAGAGNGVAVDGSGRILLGTFTISTASTAAVAGDTFDLQVSDRTGGNDFFADNGTALDALLGSASITVTVTAVPEPGTLALCGLAAAGMAGVGYRRRRRVQA